jgi:uncharacterized SAM-binding protein YcdF (DUF218 family)
MGMSIGVSMLPVVRGVGLFLGVFTLLNIAGSWRTSGFDANGWWIDVGIIPKGVGDWALVVAAAGLVAFGIGRPRWGFLRHTTAVVIGALAGVTLWNAAVFYLLWRMGRIRPGVPVPLSLVLAMVLGAIVRGIYVNSPPGNWGRRVVIAGAFLCSFVIFPLAQMYCFGETDYRRKADAIVVFGAKANADGTPSQALEDRTRTAIALYKANLAPVLIFSGGPGAGAVSEPEAMRRVALAEGVPESALVLDEEGLNTDATVANTAALCERRHIRSLLAVSHAYHLPRVKMAFARGLAGKNVEVCTVPVAEGQPLRAKPWFMAREVVALWVYYLRPLEG